MSTQTRQAVANHSKMIYSNSVYKADLLDPAKTNTYLIAMLQWTLDNLWTPILVLSIKTGRDSGMHSVGCAIDMYPGNWQKDEKATCIDMMTACSRNPYCQGVGLGGITKNWRGEVTWPASSVKFVLFDDNATDHIHASCANTVDPPGARAKQMGYTKYQG